MIFRNFISLRVFEIKNYTHQYFKQLYLKHSLPAYEKQWSNYIENKTHIYMENRLPEKEEYNQPIQLYERKRALTKVKTHTQ